MIESIYKTLAEFGYAHPLHPALAHLPIGMVTGAFLFALLALIFNRTGLARTARHCSVLALVAAIPTALLGLMDWQHFYGGSLLFPIEMKIFLASVLGVLLFIALIFGFFGERFSRVLVLMYLLCLFSVIGLGYFGGELVYGTRVPASGVSEGLAAEGARAFEQYCSACHLSDSTAGKVGPGLKGIFKVDKFPVSGWPVSEENLRKQLQEPFDKMPPFNHLKKEELDAIIEYLKTL